MGPRTGINTYLPVESCRCHDNESRILLCDSGLRRHANPLHIVGPCAVKYVSDLCVEDHRYQGMSSLGFIRIASGKIVQVVLCPKPTPTFKVVVTCDLNG